MQKYPLYWLALATVLAVGAIAIGLQVTGTPVHSLMLVAGVLGPVVVAVLGSNRVASQDTIAKVLAGDEAATKAAKAMVAPKPPTVPPAAVLCLFLAACSAAPTITAVAEAGCIALADADFPAAEPLCVFGDELAIAIEGYIQSHGGTAPAVVTSAKGTTVPHDLFDSLAQRPGIKARMMKKVCK